MTPSQENYLKTIYNENLKGNKITNKFISDMMNVSAPSVSEMMNKLIEAKLLRKDRVLGFALTDEGIAKTQILLKKHRLWEVFLINHLGYTWDEVHKDADVLEHVTSDQLLDRLNKFLGKPQYCPHGKVIYGNGIEESFSKAQKLISVDKGFEGYIHIIDDDKDLLQYLAKKEIKINEEITVADIDNFDSTIILKINERLVSISPMAAERIYVKRVGV